MSYADNIAIAGLFGAVVGLVIGLLLAAGMAIWAHYDDKRFLHEYRQILRKDRIRN